MKSTGITRRIDDLGRVVIPKEIRKNLKIHDNEILEIFVDNEKIILKKFSSLNDIENILSGYIEVLSEITLNNVLITNRDKVILTSQNKYLNKEIGNDIYLSIQNKEQSILNNTENKELIQNEIINTNCLIKPIINNGDVLGTIVVFGNNEINEKIIQSTEIISKLIINYIE